MKLGDLIRSFLTELVQKEPFKAFVRSLLGEIKPFDPNEMTPTLTAQQEAWIREVLEELNK